MNDKDLDSLIERARTSRDDSLPGLDTEALWKKVREERARQSHIINRSATLMSAAAILLVAGVSSALLFNVGPFKRAAAASGQAVATQYLEQADRVIEAFRTDMETSGQRAGLREVAGDMAILSQHLRRLSGAVDSVERRLNDVEYVLTQIAAYEPERDVEMRELDVIEYAIRLDNSWTPESEVGERASDSSQVDLFVGGRRALAERDYGRAIELLRQATENAEEKLRSHARYWLSYAHYRRGASDHDATELRVARSTLQPNLRDAQDLGVRIDVELAAMGDSAAIASQGVMAAAFLPPKSRRVPLKVVIESMSTSAVPVELRRHAMLALAATREAAFTRFLKSAAEAESASNGDSLPQQLRLVSIRALSTLNLAPATFIESVALRGDSSATGREYLATLAAIRGAGAEQPAGYAQQPAAATTVASRNEIALVPEHADLRVEFRRVINADRLGSVKASALLADKDGNIYVADRVARMIVSFNSSGVRSRAIPNSSSTVTSRAGGGASQPYRIGSLNAIALAGDTIVIADSASQELTFMSRSGEVLARRRWPVGLTSVNALFSTKTNVVGVGATGGKSGHRDVWFRVAARGLPQVKQTILKLGAEPSTISCHDRARGAVHDVEAPFPIRGTWYSVTSEGELAVAERDSIAVHIAGASDSHVTRTYAAPFARQRLTDARWEEETAPLRELQARVPGIDCGNTVSRSQFEPAVFSMVSDESDRFWIEADGTNGRQLLILDPSRSSMELTSMPARDATVQPFVRGNTMYFVAKDSLSGRSEVHALVKR